MRVAFFGNGSLSEGATVRDGTVGDRIELFRALDALGADPVYIAPRERSPGDPRVVGYTWRGPVDALVIESRDAAFAPVVVVHGEVHGKEWHRADTCPGLEGKESYDRFCEECTVLSLRDTGAIPVFPQAEVLRDWAEGKFDTDDPGEERASYGAKSKRPALLFWDFDMNVRRVLGLSGRGSYYEMGKVWKRMTPWMQETLRVVRGSPKGLVKILCPYNPNDTLLVTKRDVNSKADNEAKWKAEHDTWETVPFFDWCYPAWMENAVLPSVGHERDLVYTGSDYNRRRRWAEFYGKAAEHGWDVAVTGVWGNRRKSREKAPWDDTGWRTRVEQEWPSVEFLSGAGNRQLPFEEMLAHLAKAKACVQIVPDEYAACGYYTNRVAEAVALGVPLFVDSEIRHHGLERLGFGMPGDRPGWYRVDGWETLENRLKTLFMDDGVDRVAGQIEQQRAGLKETHSARVVAERLLREAGVTV